MHFIDLVVVYHFINNMYVCGNKPINILCICIFDKVVDIYIAGSYDEALLHDYPDLSVGVGIVY